MLPMESTSVWMLRGVGTSYKQSSYEHTLRVVGLKCSQLFCEVQDIGVSWMKAREKILEPMCQLYDRDFPTISVMAH